MSQNHSKINRKYTLVWNKLKQDRVIYLNVHPLILKSTKRGISKEKDGDINYKFNTRISGEIHKLVFSYETETHKLKIELRSPVNIGPLIS